MSKLGAHEGKKEVHISLACKVIIPRPGRVHSPKFGHDMMHPRTRD